MTDWGASNRRDSYTARLVDPVTLAEDGTSIDLVEGESEVTWSLDSDNYYTATLVVSGSVPRNRMVRILHSVEFGGVKAAEEVVGTFFVDDAPMDAGRGCEVSNCRAVSAYIRSTADRTVAPHGWLPGDSCVDAIRTFIEADGGKMELDNALPDSASGRSFTDAEDFGIGEVKSEAAERIAEWIGCELVPDRYGAIVLREDVPYGQRPVRYEFDPGDAGICEAGVSSEDSNRESVNRVVRCWSRDKAPESAKTYTDDEGEHVVKDDDGNTVYERSDDFGALPDGLWDSAIADLAPGNPFSFESMRRRVVDYEVVDPCSHEDLQRMADAALEEKCGGRTCYQISHAQIPGILPGDVVVYRNSSDFAEPVNAKCVVVEMQMRLGHGGMCKTKLREV